MSITKLVRPIFERRYHQLERYFTDAETLQRDVLQRLLEKGRMTE
jgi:hypothetical protein